MISSCTEKQQQHRKVIRKLDNSRLTHIEMATTELRSRLDELNMAAESLGRTHFEFVMNTNKVKTWEEQSPLYLIVRMRDNTLSATWYEVRWYGSRALKTRRAKKVAIPKPKARHGYNLDALLKKAQPWETELVSDTEGNLTEIRREAFFISKAIGNLNRVLNAAK